MGKYQIISKLIPQTRVSKLLTLCLPVVDSSPDLITGRWLTVIAALLIKDSRCRAIWKYRSTSHSWF